MSAALAMIGVGALAGLPAVASSGAQPSAATTSKQCYGFYPGGGYYKIHYKPGCYGHDEPMLNPESAAAGTATDITWTVVLPRDGTAAPFRKVVDMGPTFWFGATVSDANSLNSQGELEVQFYPDTTLGAPYCGSNGSYYPINTPNAYTVCMPVWAVDPITFNEYAAFNALANVSTGSTPLVMHGGDTVSVRIYVSGGHYNVFIKDITTAKQSSVIALISGADGNLSNAYTTNVRTNNIKWGGGQNTPLSLAWEIGHPNHTLYPLAPQCYAGQFNCWSYNVTNGWDKTATPLQVKSVIFKNNPANKPTSWSTVDGQGGSKQDITYCGTYNAPGSAGACTFPWYSYNGTYHAIVMGGSWPGTTFGEGLQNQYKTTKTCNGFYGPSTLYCATVMPNFPPIP